MGEQLSIQEKIDARRAARKARIEAGLPAKYVVRFDFRDCHPSDSPQVYISEEDGGRILHVFEDATPVNTPTESRDEDWEPGSLAKKLLALLNGEVAE